MKESTTDHRRARYESGLEKGWKPEDGEKAGENPNQPVPSENAGTRTSTAPLELRTDPDQGIGELGFENVDPGQPLSADPVREPKRPAPPIDRG